MAVPLTVDRRLVIAVSPKKIAWGLVLVIVSLALLSAAGQFAVHTLGYSHDKAFVKKFNLDEENNIPTWYSSTALLGCAIFLALIALAKRRTEARYAYHWGGLAVTFLLLSLDEAASIHELASAPLGRALGTSGVFDWEWVIPGLAIVLCFAMACWGFLRDLPGETRRLFVLAGATYTAGALGMELLGAYCYEVFGAGSVIYAVAATVEEFLENLGIVVFLYGLMRYLSREIGELRVDFGSGRPPRS